MSASTQATERTLTFGGHTYDGVRFEAAQYADGSLAIQARDRGEEFDDLVTTVTVYLREHTPHLPARFVFVKDYSENAGIAQQMIDLGLLDDTMTVTVDSGWVEIRAYRITDAFAAELGL